MKNDFKYNVCDVAEWFYNRLDGKIEEHQLASLVYETYCYDVTVKNGDMFDDLIFCFCDNYIFNTDLIDFFDLLTNDKKKMTFKNIDEQDKETLELILKENFLIGGREESMYESHKMELDFYQKKYADKKHQILKLSKNDIKECYSTLYYIG